MRTPAISVVIPAYAYAAGLERLLTALARQQCPFDFEVLVMDDGSPEPLGPLASRFQGILDLRCIRMANGGPARARNAGARAARGAWVAFTDHDCEPEADWLAQLHRAGEQSGPALLGGTRVTGIP